MTKRVLKTLSIAIFTGIFYTNCSQFQNKEIFTSLDSSSSDTESDAPTSPTTDDSVADSSGVLTAYQDVAFSFAVPSAFQGSEISVKKGPSWLKVSSSALKLTGVPTEIGQTSAFSIEVKTDGEVTSLGPYYIRVIGDPMKENQWHLRNTGQSAFAGHAGVADQDIHLSSTIASGIWGKGIRIVISDTGVLESHRGLTSNYNSAGARNYFQNRSVAGSWVGSATPDTEVSDYAHGTAVAGLVAESGWKGFGGRGVAPSASISGFLFLQAQESLANSGYLTAGVYDQFTGDFDIFNFSWGDLQCGLWEYEAALKYKMHLGATSLRSGKGAIYVKAAGNEYFGYLKDCYESVSSSAYYLGNSNFSEDNANPYTVVVGAVTAEGLAASYSSPGSNIWISAPGGEFGYSVYSDNTSVVLDPALITTDFVGCDKGIKAGGSNYFDQGQTPNTGCDYTATMNGTSGATPVVSGAVALILSANPSLSWRDVKHILASTADQVDALSKNIAHPANAANLSGHVYEPGWTTNTAGYRFHNWYGFGRINVDKAVTMAQNYVSSMGTFKQTNTISSSTISWKYNSGTLNASVPAGSSKGVAKTLTVAESYTIEAVQVRVQAKNCIGNLGIELTSPAGTKSVLMNINSYLQDSSMDGHTFLINTFYGENSAGTWTMKLIGGKSGCTTTWNNWQLNVMGHER